MILLTEIKDLIDDIIRGPVWMCTWDWLLVDEPLFALFKIGFAPPVKGGFGNTKIAISLGITTQFFSSFQYPQLPSYLSFIM